MVYVINVRKDDINLAVKANGMANNPNNGCLISFSLELIL